MAGQLVEIHATWDEPNFHCPACGRAVFLEDGPTEEGCPHLLFTYVSEVGDYETVAEAVKKRLKSLKDEEVDFPAPWDDRLLDILDDKDVVFSLHSTPPAGITIAAGIPFVWPRQDNSDRTRNSRPSGGNVLRC